MPQRFNAFNMGASHLSPHGYRHSSVMSQHQQHDAEMPSQTYDFNRMLQQHLSEGTSNFRSTLHNIQEVDQDENAENPTAEPTPDQSPSIRFNRQAAMTGSITTGQSHREGPALASHDRSLFHSLYGQTGGYEPLSSDLTTADMCLSTLYLHELFHRQSQRRSGANVRMQSGNNQQQNVWQLPHQSGPGTGPGAAGQSTRSIAPETRSAAEKTPLLHPKKT